MGLNSNKAPVTPFDGCGMCLLGVRRLSRVSGTTSSPERQQNLILDAVEAVGGHIIAWADDWEVSGATDPMTRPELGPWLREEKGPYDGLAGSAVDRIGRNVVDVLSTAYANHSAGRALVTADHTGVWDLNDSNQENELTLKAMGAQMEHRSIRERVRQEYKRARDAGQVTNRPAYGFKHVRPSPTAKVTHTENEKHSAKVMRNVATRILLDQTGKTTPYSEAARLNRARELSPRDWLRVQYGREPVGTKWGGKGLKDMLLSEAALGYLMHRGRPVLDKDGKPFKIAPPLWDRATHEALKAKLAPKGIRSNSRTPKGANLVADVAFCGNCNDKLYRAATVRIQGVLYPAYHCTARQRGIPESWFCGRPRGVKDGGHVAGVVIAQFQLNETVAAWFLERYGSGQLMKSVYDPGTGYASQIAELESSRTRLREDRNAGVYDAPEDAEWFRTRFAELGREINELKKQPDRPAGWVSIPTGKTVADEWHAATDDAERREMLEAHGVRVVVNSVASGRERVVITAEVAHDPGAEATGAQEGDQERPGGPNVGRTSVRLSDSVLVA
ncbi:recombinase family protein [Streptomyces sp. NPDC055897]